MVIPALIGLGALALAAGAEWLHARRVARVARLAFGPAGRPAWWARGAPHLRAGAFAAAAWGAAALLLYDPVEGDDRPPREASKHLLVALDVSPSMMLEDAGPDVEKVSRGVWGGRLVQGVLDRLDTDTTRVTLFAFYTDGLPVVQETFDKEVVRNALDGLPMYVAFQPGATDVNKGVSKALEHARVWPRNSAMLVVVSDGDTTAGTVPISRPDSIADVVVIGVGDPYRPQVINGHSSRQDAPSLKQLAARLGGIYHDGNVKHLPSSVLDGISVTSPRATEAVTLRDAALMAVGIGSSVLALLGPALILLGRPATYRRARSEVARRSRSAPRRTRRPTPALAEA